MLTLIFMVVLFINRITRGQTADSSHHHRIVISQERATQLLNKLLPWLTEQDSN